VTPSVLLAALQAVHQHASTVYVGETSWHLASAFSHALLSKSASTTFASPAMDSAYWDVPAWGPPIVSTNHALRGTATEYAFRSAPQDSTGRESLAGSVQIAEWDITAVTGKGSAHVKAGLTKTSRPRRSARSAPSTACV